MTPSPFSPLTPDPAHSPTLPGWFYNESSVYKAENENIFYKSWQLVAHESQLQKEGDFVCAEVADQNIFVIRGKDDTVRGFYNVCQHRAHELLEGSGCANKLIVCPYHAWTFTHEGDLQSARHTQDMPNFDKANFGLAPVRIESELGFYFANLDDTAPSLNDVFGDLFEDIRAHVPWWNEVVISNEMVNQSWEGSLLEANWKVLAENCLECYHCHPVHPALVDLLDMQTYTVEPNGYWIRSGAHVNKVDNKAYHVEPHEPSQDGIFWYMWPNMALSIVPGEAAVSGFRFSPTNAETTKMASIVLTKPNESIKPERLDYRWNILWPEDETICASVHRGLKSKGYKQGRFIIDPNRREISEHGVHYFQSLYAEAMAL